MVSTKTRSLTSLKSSIEGKYSAILKLDGELVKTQEGVEDYVQQMAKPVDHKASLQDGPRISMTITINQVDQRRCAHFLWDLTQMAMRDDFRFVFPSDSGSTVHHDGDSTIALDEFDMNRDIALHAIDYIMSEPDERTKEIGQYLIYWLPHHLQKIHELEHDSQEVTRAEKCKIGKGFYELFTIDTVMRRHKDTLGQIFWTEKEMQEIRIWVTDHTALTSLEDENWTSAMIKSAMDLETGFLKNLVKLVLEELLRAKVWDVTNACTWLQQFAHLVSHTH